MTKQILMLFIILETNVSKYLMLLNKVLEMFSLLEVDFPISLFQIQELNT